MKNLILMLIFSLLFIFCLSGEPNDVVTIFIKCSSPPNEGQEVVEAYILLFSIVMNDKTHRRDGVYLRWHSQQEQFFGDPLWYGDYSLSGYAGGNASEIEVITNDTIPCSNIESVMMFKCVSDLCFDEAGKWIDAANTDHQDEMPDPTLLEPFEITYECGITYIDEYE